MRKRLFAALLCVMMVLTLLPVTALAADGPKTYTFTSTQIFGLTELRANVYFKGDTIIFTPDAIEPFTSSDHGVCKTPNVGLKIVGGADVTGGICSVNTYSSDGSGCMVSFTITSDNPVTLDYKGAGPTGVQTTPDANNNYYAYRYMELQFVAHPTSYPVEYDLGTYGSWVSGANQPTALVLNGNTGTYELQIPTPQSTQGYYFTYWLISENARILDISNLGNLSYPILVYLINGSVSLPINIGKSKNDGSLTGTERFVLTAIWSTTQPTPAPTFSVAGGTYSSPQTVALSCTTPNATIRYTTDGSVPNTRSTAYTTAITVSSTTTIVAKAFAPDGSGIPGSDAVSQTYTISSQPPVSATVATPTFSPAGGTFTSMQSVTLSCATAGATIRYTTNGNDPTESSPIYSTAIPVSSTTTIKAKAFKDGMTASTVVSATYTISAQPGSDPEPTPTEYPIIEGENGRWTTGSTVGLTIRVNGDYAKFQSVSVDGSIIDSDKYTDEPGSTVVTLKPAYLEALSAGGHTLRINFTDGYAETTFTVSARELDPVPQTGDSSNTILWITLLLIGGTGLTATSAYYRKKKRSATK